MPSGTMTIVNDWALFGHPLFLGRFEALIAEAETLALKTRTDFITISISSFWKRATPTSWSAFRKLLVPGPTFRAIRSERTVGTGAG